jgi:hypothetical protein
MGAKAKVKPAKAKVAKPATKKAAAKKPAARKPAAKAAKKSMEKKKPTAVAKLVRKVQQAVKKAKKGRRYAALAPSLALERHPALPCRGSRGTGRPLPG